MRSTGWVVCRISSAFPSMESLEVNKFDKFSLCCVKSSLSSASSEAKQFPWQKARNEKSCLKQFDVYTTLSYSMNSVFIFYCWSAGLLFKKKKLEIISMRWLPFQNKPRFLTWAPKPKSLQIESLNALLKRKAQNVISTINWYDCISFFKVHKFWTWTIWFTMWIHIDVVRSGLVRFMFKWKRYQRCSAVQCTI